MFFHLQLADSHWIDLIPKVKEEISMDILPREDKVPQWMDQGDQIRPSPAELPSSTTNKGVVLGIGCRWLQLPFNGDDWPIVIVLLQDNLPYREIPGKTIYFDLFGVRGIYFTPPVDRRRSRSMGLVLLFAVHCQSVYGRRIRHFTCLTGVVAEINFTWP